jgi:hypothetical protein
VQTVNGRQQLYVLLVHAVLSVFVVVAVTVLAILHDLEPQAVTTLFGVAVGLVGGSAGSLAVVGFVTNGNGKPPAPPAPPDTGG